MSFKKSISVVGALGAMLLSGSALAGEFDGQYDVEYQLIGGELQLCPMIRGHQLSCINMMQDVRLYDGQLTEESVQGLADEMIGEVEAASGQDVPEELEAQIHAAAAEVYATVGDELNQGLLNLPIFMSLMANKKDPNVLQGSMICGNGILLPAYGSIDNQTGDYSLLVDMMQGYFDRNAQYSGRGSVEFPIETGIEYGQVYVAIHGAGFANYDAWRQATSGSTTSAAPQPVPSSQPQPKKVLW